MYYLYSSTSFDEEPQVATVAASSEGGMKDKESKNLFKLGYEEMILRLQPEAIIVYGTILDECMGNIIRVKTFMDKFKEATCSW